MTRPVLLPPPGSEPWGLQTVRWTHYSPACVDAVSDAVLIATVNAWDPGEGFLAPNFKGFDNDSTRNLMGGVNFVMNSTWAPDERK